MHVIYANPFEFSDSVYPKVVETVKKVGLLDGRTNLTVLRSATHPAASRRTPAFVPGWNASNTEISVNGEHECAVIFDRSGEIVFRGRLTVESAEARLRDLLDPR